MMSPDIKVVLQVDFASHETRTGETGGNLMKAFSKSSSCQSAACLLLAVLVLLAVGREALGLQELGSSSSLAEHTLVFF